MGCGAEQAWGLVSDGWCTLGCLCCCHEVGPATLLSQVGRREKGAGEM